MISSFILCYGHLIPLSQLFISDSSLKEISDLQIKDNTQLIESIIETVDSPYIYNGYNVTLNEYDRLIDLESQNYKSHQERIINSLKMHKHIPEITSETCSYRGVLLTSDCAVEMFTKFQVFRFEQLLKAFINRYTDTTCIGTLYHGYSIPIALFVEFCININTYITQEYYALNSISVEVSSEPVEDIQVISVYDNLKLPRHKVVEFQKELSDFMIKTHKINNTKYNTMMVSYNNTILPIATASKLEKKLYAFKDRQLQRAAKHCISGINLIRKNGQFSYQHSIQNAAS